MHVNRALLGWGVFFLVLGSVPLAVRYGLVDASAFATAWQLWPLLLIGAGLGLVLARTRGRDRRRAGRGGRPRASWSAGSS